MSAARASADAARLPLMLTDLRLPTIKRLWTDLAAQSDREGWRAARRHHQQGVSVTSSPVLQERK